MIKSHSLNKIQKYVVIIPVILYNLYVIHRKRRIIMKKKLVLSLIMLMGVSLVGCSDSSSDSASSESSGAAKVVEEVAKKAKTEELLLGESVTVEGIANMELVKISTTDTITGSSGGGYTITDANNTYVDLVLKYTNTSDSSIDIYDIFTAYAKSGSSDVTHEQMSYYLEAGNVSSYGDINSQEQTTLHVAFSVPKTETSVELFLEIGDNIYTVSYEMNDYVADVNEVKKGDAMDVEDYAKVTFNGVSYTKDVVPADTSRVYNHYEIDNKSNSYMVIKMNLVNFQTSSMQLSDFMNLKVTYMDKYEYTGFPVLVDGDKKGFSSGYTNMDPLVDNEIYYLVEVPDTVKDDDYKINIIMNGSEFLINK